MNRASLIVLTVIAMLATCAAQAPSSARDPLSLVKSDFFTTSDGVRIHYLDAGKGPAIVFIPGWTMPAWIWEKQIAHFAPQYRVIAIDPRSQNESDKPVEGNYPERRARDYKELVDHLKLTPVVLVGWSMGVPEIFAYVNQFGTTDLRAAVLVDGFIALDESTRKLFFQLTHMIAADRTNLVSNFVRDMYSQPQPAAYYARLIADSLKTPTNTAAELLIVSHQDWTATLPKLSNTPVLYITTTHVKPQIEIARRAIPNLQSEVLDDAKHALFVDHAERFNSTSEKFIAGTAAK